MTILQHEQKKEQRRQALLGAQYTNTRAYRGVPYTQITNGKPVHGNLTYRGVAYSK